MSNYIRIHRPEPLQEFIVAEVDADTHEAYCKIGEYATLEDAVEAANAYME